MVLRFSLYCEYCWKKMLVSKILWASRIFSKIILLVSHKGKKPTVTRAPSLPHPFLHCMLPTSRKSNPSPVLPVPPAGSLVQDSLWAPRSHHSHSAPRGVGFPGRVGLEGSFELPLRSTLLHSPYSVSWWSRSGSELLIDSTPGSFFLVIPAGRVWCIKELQRLKLGTPVIFNHLVPPPTWAGVFLMLFFLMLYLV